MKSICAKENWGRAGAKMKPQLISIHAPVPIRSGNGPLVCIGKQFDLMKSRRCCSRENPSFVLPSAEMRIRFV